MNENQEVKETSTDATLASSCTEGNENEVNEAPELNSSAVPTAEQVKDAGMAPDVNSNPAVNENAVANEGPMMTDEQQAVEKMLSQSQVDEIVGRTRIEARDKALKDIYNRFEVSDDNGLDSLFAKSQAYDTLKDETDSIIGQMKNELGEVKSKIAMYESNIAPERYEDVKLILKGKGLDITAENILSEIETHPEWKKAEVAPQVPEENVAAEGNFMKREAAPEAAIQVLGNDRPEQEAGPTEREFAMKNLFGL